MHQTAHNIKCHSECVLIQINDRVYTKVLVSGGSRGGVEGVATPLRPPSNPPPNKQTNKQTDKPAPSDDTFEVAIV